jgi:hypothetical protein
MGLIRRMLLWILLIVIAVIAAIVISTLAIKLEIDPRYIGLPIVLIIAWVWNFRKVAKEKKEFEKLVDEVKAKDLERSETVCENLGGHPVELPDRTSGHPIPSIMIDLIKQKKWPVGRISTSSIARQDSCKFLGKLDLEFLRSEDGMKADLDTLKEFAEHEQTSKTYGLRIGSQSDAPIELPWLDVEKAVCIGGGADYGDDVWLLLDYRTNGSEPRLIANEFQHGETTQCFWREVAPSLTDFCQQLGLVDGSYKSAEPEPVSKDIIKQLNSISRSKRPRLTIQIEPLGLRVQEMDGVVIKSVNGKETQLCINDEIQNPCILKLAGGSKLSISCDGDWVSTCTPDDNGAWIDLRTGAFSLTYVIDV